jgi:LmbE family N-acetylglucosaminyl deacetylase
MPDAYALVVAAHPDDSEFGVAGTAAHWVREQKRVVYAIVTNGDKGTSDPNLRPEELRVMREKEQREAAKVVGVSEVVFMGYPDQGVEDTPELRKDIVRLIRTYRPKLIATSDPYRKYIWHRDHRLTGQVVLDAVFPFARDYWAYPDLIEEGLQPHKVEELLLWGSEDLNLRLDITDTWSLKMEALFCHQSQFGRYPKDEFEGRLRDRYCSLAEGEPFELAEAFHQVHIRM